MIQKGFIEEVRGFYERADMHGELPSMRAVGYRQLWQYLDGKHSLADACRLAVTATRQLAKRQMTWLRGDAEINWINAQDVARIEQDIRGAG